MGDARRRVMRELDRGGSAQSADDPGKHHRQAIAAGVDDAGLAQNRKQVRARLTDSCPADSARSITSARSASCSSTVASGLEPGLRHVGELARDPVRHLAHHRQDRALRRVADRAVRLVGGPGQRGADQHRIDQFTGPGDELLGGPANQLGQDHAGVSARAQQRRACDRADDLLAADFVDRPVRRCIDQAIELVQDRP